MHPIAENIADMQFFACKGRRITETQDRRLQRVRYYVQIADLNRVTYLGLICRNAQLRVPNQGLKRGRDIYDKILRTIVFFHRSVASFYDYKTYSGK